MLFYVEGRLHGGGEAKMYQGAEVFKRELQGEELKEKTFVPPGKVDKAKNYVNRAGGLLPNSGGSPRSCEILQPLLFQAPSTYSVNIPWELGRNAAF